MEDSPDVYADTYPVFHPSSPPETEGVVPSTPVLRVVKGGGVGGGSSSGVPSGLNTPSSVASSQGLWGMPPRSRRSSRSGTPAPTSQGLLPAQRELADVVRNIWSWGNGGSRAATPVMSSPGDAKVPSTPSVEVGKRSWLKTSAGYVGNPGFFYYVAAKSFREGKKWERLSFFAVAAFVLVFSNISNYVHN